MNEKIFVVIPAFNEGKNIGSILSDLLTAGYNNLVVVDDCSEDNTLQVVSNFPVFLLHHAINRGQGASLKTGIDFALK
ncbi:MAG: glycosyltransferase, partial [Firmicutes bacterium]|nr:glycosyltransferase [Bacillota bacterium]